MCLLVLLSACSPKVRTYLIAPDKAVITNEPVVLLGLTDPISEDAVTIGTVKVGDTGFTTDCSFETVIHVAQSRAAEMGGNVFKLTSHKYPSVMSSCHRIEGEVLRTSDPEKLRWKLSAASHKPDSAVIYIYRNSSYGALVYYDLYLNDSVICNVTQGCREVVYLRQPGMYKLWAKTEKTETLTLQVELGKVYYVECGVAMGVLIGRPMLDLVDEETGRLNYQLDERQNE